MCKQVIDTRTEMIYVVRAPQYVGRPEKTIADLLLEQWDEAGVTFIEIGDRVPKKIVKGVFYDHEESLNHYIETFNTLKRRIKDGDTILLIEGWNASVPFYRQYIDTLDLEVGLFGIFHSSVYVPGEFFSDLAWAKTFEHYLYSALDKILVATDYMREHLATNNARVTGLPLPNDVKTGTTFAERENIIAFSHRWDKDKRPEVFLRLAEILKDTAEFWLLTPKEVAVDNKHIKVVVNKTREEYLHNLSKAKIIFSSAELETFGYSVIEGVMSGCRPLLPHAACYTEQYVDEYLYKNENEMVEKATNLLRAYSEKDPMKMLRKYEDAPMRVLEEITDENFPIRG